METIKNMFVGGLGLSRNPKYLQLGNNCTLVNRYNGITHETVCIQIIQAYR